MSREDWSTFLVSVIVIASLFWMFLTEARIASLDKTMATLTQDNTRIETELRDCVSILSDRISTLERKK